MKKVLGFLVCLVLVCFSGYCATMHAVETESRTINFDNSMTTSEIQAEIDAVGKYIPSGVTITFQFDSSGSTTYTLDSALRFEGFYGGGGVVIQGNTSETNATSLHTSQDVYLDFSGQSCNGLEIYFCRTGGVTVKNLKIEVNTSSAAKVGVYSYGNSRFSLQYSYILGTSTSYGYGVRIRDGACGELYRTYLSNVYCGLRTSFVGSVASRENDDTGTQPVYGMEASFASTIGKYDSQQPSGSTSDEYTTAGGEIR